MRQWISINRKEIKEDNNFSKIKFITNRRPGYIKKIKKANRDNLG